MASVRALLQRLGPHVEDVEPVVIASGRPARLRPSSLARLVGLGYRREELGRAPRRGRRAGLDRRRVPVARPTLPCASTSGATRSTGSRSSRSATSARPTTVDEAVIFPAASCSPPTRSRTGRRAGRRRAVGSRAVGAAGRGARRSTAWSLGCRGSRRRARSSSTSRSRRPGAARRAAAHARPGGRPPRRGGRPRATLARTWGAVRGRGRRLPAPAPAASTGCSHGPRRPRWTVVGQRPRAADSRPWRRRPGPRWSATARRSSRSCATAGRRLPRRGRGRRATASAGDWPSCCATRARPSRSHGRSDAPRVDDRGRAARARLRPRRDQAGRAGRGRPHRPPPRPPPARPRARDAAGFFDDLKAGDYVVHYQHGVGRYGGMVKRAIGGVERDYLLLEYKGGDKLYVPSDQIDAVRHYTGGETPALSPPGRRRLGEGQGRVRSAVARDRPGARRALPEAAARAGPRVPAGHAVAARAGGGVPVRGDARSAQGHRRREGRHGEPSIRWTACVCGDVGFGKTEVAIRAVVQGDPGRQAGRGPRAHHAARAAALPDVQRPLRRLPDPGRGAEPLPHDRRRPARSSDGHAARARSTCVIGTHRLLSEDIQFKDLGLLVVDEEQRFGVTHKERSSSCRPTSTCSR